MKKQSLIDKRCAGLAAELTTGMVFSVDPSIGSQSSQPGYAVWIGGELVDSGTIELGCSKTAPTSSRLHHLRMSLEKEFDKPNVVIVERVVANARAKAYNNNTAVKANQAIGVVMAQWDVPIIEVSPNSWKATAKDLPKYEKTDEWDAIAIGWCCLVKATTYLEGE